MTKSKYLITGVGGPAGRSLATLLIARRCAFIGSDSRLLDPVDYPLFQVPMACQSNYLNVIQTMASKEQVTWIIPTVSEELPIVSAGWTSHEARVLIGSASAVACANDKYLTIQTLQQAGVPVPRFALPSQIHSPGELASLIGWPCISKPRIGRGGREVTYYEEGNFTPIASLSDDYILQEFANGVDYAPELFINPNQEGNLVIVLEKTELKEGRVGNAVAVKRVYAPDVASIALAAAKAAGLIGPLDIDIRRKADGAPVVLEINARFGANICSAPEIFDAALDFMQA